MKLFQRNAGLLLTSFLVSGLVNVHAQEFFAAHASAAKERWLAAVLVLGTLASIASVRWSKAHGFGRSPALVGISLVAWMLIASGCLFCVPWLLAYAALHVLVRAMANYLTQELDRRATALAPGQDRGRNDQIGSALRFVGMLLGPLWLGALGHSGWATGAILVSLGVLTAGACVAVARAPATPAIERGRSTSLEPGQARIWISAVCIYGSYYLLASSAVYVLRDVHGREDAARVGSALIATVYASAIASTIVIGLLTRRGLSLSWMRVAPLTMALVAAALGTPSAAKTGVLFAGGVGLGVAFALFLLSFREHVTARAAAGEPQWIPAYNNLGNSSALVGFGAMAVLVMLRGFVFGSYAVRLECGLIALSALALVAGFRTRSRAPATVGGA